MLPARKAKPRIEGSHHAKYAIIGAGYTGLAAARRLAEIDPHADVVVVDASEIGEGSSGRNSGFTRPIEFPLSLTPANADKAKVIAAFNQEGFDYLKHAIDEFAIGCDLVQAGVIRGAATTLGETHVRSSEAELRAMGIEAVFLNRGDLENGVGTNYYKCGLHVKNSYLLQPAALIRGLADNLPRSVQLFENSHVQKIARNTRWTLSLNGADIETDYLILATNAFIKEFGHLKDRLVAVYTYAAVTEAMSLPDTGAIGSMPTWGILPAHRLGTTCRRVGPNRLLVRSLQSYERELSPSQVHDRLREKYVSRWPHLAHVKFEHVWGGTTAITLNGSPWWGKLDDGLYASVGCNGAGITKGTLLGKRLAELIVGVGSHEGLQAAFGRANWIVPEPFRRTGFNLTVRSGLKEAGREA